MSEQAGATSDLRARLARGAIVGDGAMGTMLHAVGASLDRCLPELNLSRPELVQDIHRAYVEAGAEIIETNTFGANRLSMTRFGLADEVELVNAAAVRLAREARDDGASGALIAGSIGPAFGPGAAQHDASLGLSALLEQAEALEEAGVDLLLLETFGDLGHLVELVSKLKARSRLAIVAQVTFTEDRRTLSGHPPEEVARQLEGSGVDAFGANCTLGPRGILPLVEALAAASSLPISAQPNAGPPRRVRGRVEYRPNEDYFARAAANLVRHGARIVGGCCGTTPRHIEAIVRHLGEAPNVTVDDDAPPPARELAAARPLRLLSASFPAKILAGEFVVAAEVAAPNAADATTEMNEAAALLEAGATTLFVTSSGHSGSSMGSVSFAVLLRDRLGVEAVVSMTTYRNSVLGLEADLLGAHALGLRSVLCTTGAPQPEGDYPATAQLFDVSATDLIEALTVLNGARGRDGRDARRATAFLVGAQIDPGAPDLDAEVERVRADLGAGAQFLVTTPTFELAGLESLLGALGRPEVPLLLGIAPLGNYAQAEYLHFERPQITISESVLERLRVAGDDTQEVGRALARELVEAAAGMIAGVVIYRAPGVDAGALISDLQHVAMKGPATVS